ncbi:MAG: hypothetical protein ACLPJH_08750 [Myxococcaceae bacterium]
MRSSGLRSEKEDDKPEAGQTRPYPPVARESLHDFFSGGGWQTARLADRDIDLHCQPEGQLEPSAQDWLQM